jgi:hypothetical protein
MPLREREELVKKRGDRDHVDAGAFGARDRDRRADDACDMRDVVRRLGPVVRLGSTKTARTLRKEREPFHITDGPYAETKEQILGFWIVDCDSDDEAMETAQELGKVNPGGAFAVRPLTLFLPGTSLAETASVAAPNASGH